jgi:hypothetical protein
MIDWLADGPIAVSSVMVLLALLGTLFRFSNSPRFKASSFLTAAAIILARNLKVPVSEQYALLLMVFGGVWEAIDAASRLAVAAPDPNKPPSQ